MVENLTFAPLIRVSTEAQAKKGESLSTQQKQLQAAIDSLGGKVYCWYAGQEHATPDQERKILEKLMADARQRKFDAVVVADTSRWSRDNLKSSQDLGELKKNGIRFFVGTQEFDLNDHFDDLVLTMGVAINQFFAREQASKSSLNRIERAKKGYPACGKRPWGRVFDKETCTWKVDEAKKEMVAEIARLYLEEDVSFNELGKMYKMNGTNLHKILTKRSGDTWTQRFRNRHAGTDETITTAIPRLLPDDIILKVRAKCEARRTWEHGKYKYEYLFSRIIRDADTEHALTGTGNSLGRRYYKPFKGTKTIPRYMINANTLENAILDQLFTALGNSSVLNRAVFDGHSVADTASDLKEKKSRIEKELASLERERQRYVEAIGVADDDIKSFIAKLKPKVKALEDKIEKATFEKQILENQLSTLPTLEEIEAKRRWYGQRLRQELREIDLELMGQQLLQRQNESYFSCGHSFMTLPFEKKKKLINLIFGGRDDNGKRYGIYVQLLSGRPRHYRYEAYGRLGTIDGWIQSKVRVVHSEGPYFDPFKVDQKVDETMSHEIAEIVVEANPKLIAAHHDVSESKTMYTSYSRV